MPDNSILIQDLKLRQLRDADSLYEAKKLVEYFVTEEAARKLASENSVAHAMLDLALHKDISIRRKALWGLVQLERWKEIGQLLRLWIDPEKELWRVHGKNISTWLDAYPLRMEKLDAIKRDLVIELEEVDTSELWPAVRNYFRRKDETIRQRAIMMCGVLKIKPALRSLKRILKDPEKSALHREAQIAIWRLEPS